MCLCLYACTCKDRHLWTCKHTHRASAIRMTESRICTRWQTPALTTADITTAIHTLWQIWTCAFKTSSICLHWTAIKTEGRHQLVLEFYLFNVQKQFLCLWCKLSSTTGKLHLSDYCIQGRGKDMTALQRLSAGTLQGLAFWVLISKVSSHSKNSEAILA